MTTPRERRARADPGASSASGPSDPLDARPPHDQESSPRPRAWVQRGIHVFERARLTRVWRAVSRFTQVGGGVLSAGMSYQALFAVFAGLWLGFSAIGIWLRDRTELLDSLVDQINMFVPGLIGREQNSLVSLQDLLGASAVSVGGIIASISLAFVAVLWFTGTRRAIRITFDLEVKEYRNWFLLKLRDLVLALGFSLAIVISSALTLVSTNVFDTVLDWLGWGHDSWIVGGLGTVARYAAMYAFDVIVLMAMFRYLAEVRVPRTHLLAGCALGAGATFLLKIAGAALLSNVTSNPLLAPFAVVIGLLLWFNFICRTLLLTASWIATGEDDQLGLPEAGPLAPTPGPVA
ncbi:YihY/virulence factor BrkB family protein [Leucobacter tardus]|uniref:YihY/virulence factor BrkB family protein n=1 Tax=Leucobacter tardus TaxID=501483 RepID=A0A939TP29_9MICO|nr:YihY/virulence factor BrkB family protein [Leucobacter tardus]MBO2990839.1 YihY/virulence factor BrkB family protein [Leucobacter tardus]